MYSSDHRGETQTREHDMSTDPSPRNRFGVFLENSICVYMRSMGRTCWPRFSKFGTNILFRNILDKFVGQR